MVDKTITGEEGVTYVTNFGVYSTDGTNITTDKLHKLRNNAYGKEMTLKLKNRVFERINDAYIEVLDADFKPAEKQQLKINKVFDKVDYRSSTMLAFDERIWMGKGIFNHVWAPKGNEIILFELRHLPSHSFGNPPADRDRYCDILKGITLNPQTKKIEYWQTDPKDGLTPKQLDSNKIIMMGDSSDIGLGGDPLIRPLVPVMEMLSYTWNTEMQRLIRVGSPIMFIKITKPKIACDANGNVGDITYAEKLMQYWGKDSHYPLRENMEIIWPDFKDSTSTTDVIYTLTNLITDYCTPVGFVSKEGRLIGQNSDDGDAYWAYTRGQHRWIELSMQPLIDKYMEYNGYMDDYIAYLKFPTVGRSKAEIMLRQAELIARTRGGSVHEFRERIECAAKDDATLLKYAEQWKQILPDPKALDKDKAMLPSSGLINKEELMDNIAKIINS